MAYNTYTLGKLIRLSNPFKVAGVLTDPTTITCYVRDPAGTITTYAVGAGAIVRDSTGNYHLDVRATLPGRWEARWVGTGAVDTADEEIFYVQPSRFP